MIHNVCIHSMLMILFIVYFRVLIPPMNYNGDICVEFWYSMHGFHVGALEVFYRNGNSDSAVWTLSGQQDNRWNNQRVTVSDYRNFYKVGTVSSPPGVGSFSYLMVVGTLTLHKNRL